MPAKNGNDSEPKALALLERIASAVEFLAGMNGHVPTAPALAPDKSSENGEAKQETASE
jgi:hypothetical protein